jgi:hypothetical protein
VHPVARAVFQEEVARQCDFGLRASKNMAAALDANDLVGVFASIQALITAAANVHKLLWGAPSRRTSELLPDRPGELRRSLLVDDTSPLSERGAVLRFRDLEHFDERLDEWAAQDPLPSFIDSEVGRGMGRVVEGGPRPRSFHRNFDSKDWVYSFWDRDYELRPIIDELTRLRDIARAETAKAWGTPLR